MMSRIREDSKAANREYMRAYRARKAGKPYVPRKKGGPFPAPGLVTPCSGAMHLFFPEDDDYTAARKVCRACPHRAPCAEAGKHE